MNTDNKGGHMQTTTKLDPITPEDAAAWTAAWDELLARMSPPGAAMLNAWTRPDGTSGPVLKLVGMSLGVHVCQASDALAHDLAMFRRPWLAVLRSCLDGLEIIDPPDWTLEELPVGIVEEGPAPDPAAELPPELDADALANWGRGK